MANELIIRVLGPLVIELNGRDLTPHLSRKAQALLVYLACQQRPVAREVLTTLLWADSSAEQGMTNLRKTLSELRRWLPDHLTAERQTIELAPPFWLDMAELNHRLPKETPAAAEMAEIATAVTLYRGPFLDNFSFADSPDFTLWAALQQEQVRQLVITAWHHLADDCLRQRRYNEGVQYARQLVEIEPLSESASRLLMLLLARSGQAEAALAEYDRCRQQLQIELGVKPTAVTQTLHQRIQTAMAMAEAPDRATLPTPHTSFVGREAELSQINQHLADPTGRWLTITGPGGVGKTRLALQIAAEWGVDFLHGVFFVSLAAIDSPATLAAAIAAALHAPLTGPEPPQQQLLNYLRQKELLLLLDNGETLLAPALVETADLLPEILQHAPQVRLLVTSRERFNYQAEQVVTLDGLPLTEEAGLRLFLERARQVQPDFGLTPDTRPAIHQICRLVEGLPLGIELAAASLDAYSPAEIAAGIAQTLDFLQQDGNDGRHHSLRAVFESAWQHLSAEEQTTFVALSVFPGGLTAAAARAVARATPPLLLSLVDKSMLRLMRERYQLHELLRQFATEKLALAGNTAVHAQFSRYFADFLQAQGERLHGREQQQALQTIDAEIDNIRAAWNWLVAHHGTAEISRSLSALHHFYDMRGRFVEGEASFRLAAAQWPPQTDDPAGQVLAGRLLARQGFFLERLSAWEAAADLFQTSLTLIQGHDPAEEAFVLNQLGLTVYNQGAYEQAEMLYRRSLEISRQAGATTQEATTLVNLGALLREQGNYQAARRLIEEGLALQRPGEDPRQLAITLQVLGSVLEAQGAYGEAQTHYQQSLVICQQLEDRLGQAILCNHLGNSARQQNALPEAQAWGQQALALFQEIGDPWGIAIASVRLGDLALVMGNYDQARQLFQAGLKICQEVGDQRGTAVSLCNLAYVALALERLPKARELFRQAIEIAAAIQFMPLLLKALAGTAQWLYKVGEREKATTVAAFVHQHPATDDGVREQAATLRQNLLASLSSEETTAVPPTESPDLHTILSLLEVGD